MLTHTNPPLPPYPWLAQSDPALSITDHASSTNRQGSRKRPFPIAIEVGLVGLCGGVSLLLLWPDAQPVPAVEVAGPVHTAIAAVVPEPEQAGVADSAALIAVPAPVMRAAAPPAKLVKAAPQPPRGAPLIGSSAVADPVIATEPAPVVVPPAPPVAETSASPAMIAEFRSVMDESRDTARLVIRLASRERPARDASAEALTGYRLRQQNADAARGYRRYLDTLARSMRGAPSVAASQQSLERARQTQAYLATMLADSQASLR